YFYPFQKLYTEFSAGDIISFAEKFVIKNSEKYAIVSHVSLIASGNINQEFIAEEISISILHCIFPVIVKQETNVIRNNTTYFNADCYHYNSHTGSRNVLMKLRILFPFQSQRFIYFHTGIKVGLTNLDPLSNSNSSLKSNDNEKIDQNESQNSVNKDDRDLNSDIKINK
ncbi:27682_t:CDS:2, partial [Dentiscutata erythropus]